MHDKNAAPDALCLLATSNSAIPSRLPNTMEALAPAVLKPASRRWLIHDAANCADSAVRALPALLANLTIGTETGGQARLGCGARCSAASHCMQCNPRRYEGSVFRGSAAMDIASRSTDRWRA